MKSNIKIQIREHCLKFSNNFQIRQKIEIWEELSSPWTSFGMQEKNSNWWIFFKYDRKNFKFMHIFLNRSIILKLLRILKSKRNLELLKKYEIDFQKLVHFLNLEHFFKFFISNSNFEHFPIMGIFLEISKHFEIRVFLKFRALFKVYKLFWKFEHFFEVREKILKVVNIVF